VDDLARARDLRDTGELDPLDVADDGDSGHAALPSRSRAENPIQVAFVWSWAAWILAARRSP
jgi:hypothetical protein